MPRGTRVYRCVQALKGKVTNPYGICQASTKQNYRTGKTIKRRKKKK